MDPFTLFALANGAVSAVKAGCQLYKDIKGAAGDIKTVLKDLDDQFHNAHKDKPASVEARNQYVQEKNRIIEMNKRKGEVDDVYIQLGNHLGDYFDNMTKCMAVLEEEERKTREEIYTGDASLGKRALQLVLMKKKLEAMTVELREMMIYNAPLELGALWTDVSEMMTEMGKRQKILIAQKMQEEEALLKIRKAKMKHVKHDIVGAGIVFGVQVFRVAALP